VRHEENGLLAPDGDGAAAAEGVLRLLRDRAMADRLGRAGRDWVLTRFAASRLIADVDALYQELLRERGLSLGGHQPS
jgi:glycosyltransferase involved in cell wall biosynthesis